MLRPEKDLLVSSHEFQLVKEGVGWMFFDLWPCRPLWQVWPKAARRCAGRSSITLGSTTQTAAYSTAAAPERDKPDGWWNAFLFRGVVCCVWGRAGVHKPFHLQSNLFLYFKISQFTFGKGPWNNPDYLCASFAPKLYWVALMCF